MTGNVVQISTAVTLDDAWEAYRSHTAESFENPKLLLDRGWVEENTRRRARFDRLFLRKESGR